jgi:hypothetical protein
MNQDELDRMLSGEREIVPSSSFVTNVMDAVRREASTPPAIPFPWKWALPGLAAWAGVLVSFLMTVWAQVGAMAPEATVPEGAKDIGLEWIALALLMAFASVTLSMRLVGARN